MQIEDRKKWKSIRDDVDYVVNLLSEGHTDDALWYYNDYPPVIRGMILAEAEANEDVDFDQMTALLKAECEFGVNR